MTEVRKPPLSNERYDEIVAEVRGWFEDVPTTIRAEFISSTGENLIRYHHTLGTAIRNEFHLWQFGWEPEIVNGIDMSQNHPDAISQRIIVDVWKAEVAANK